jgi:hypothetical protein
VLYQRGLKPFARVPTKMAAEKQGAGGSSSGGDTIGSEHTIAEQSGEGPSPPASPEEDTVMYCHFIPKKEYVEKGTPWIIHTPTKCHVCATVHFESMAMMRTAGPGGEAPDPVVCHCGVSRHHLRVEGYVTMSDESTPHPKATIRSHRPSIVNVPEMQAKIAGFEASLKGSKSATNKGLQKIRSEREVSAALRAKHAELQRAAEARAAALAKAEQAAAQAKRKLKEKELQRDGLARECKELRRIHRNKGGGSGHATAKGGGGGGGGTAGGSSEEGQLLSKLRAENAAMRVASEEARAGKLAMQEEIDALRVQLAAAQAAASSRPPSRRGESRRRRRRRAGGSALAAGATGTNAADDATGEAEGGSAAPADSAPSDAAVPPAEQLLSAPDGTLPLAAPSDSSSGDSSSSSSSSSSTDVGGADAADDGGKQPPAPASAAADVIAMAAEGGGQRCGPAGDDASEGSSSSSSTGSQRRSGRSPAGGGGGDDDDDDGTAIAAAVAATDEPRWAASSSSSSSSWSSRQLSSRHHMHCSTSPALLIAGGAQRLQPPPPPPSMRVGVDEGHGADQLRRPAAHPPAPSTSAQLLRQRAAQRCSAAPLAVGELRYAGAGGGGGTMAASQSSPAAVAAGGGRAAAAGGGGGVTEAGTTTSTTTMMMVSSRDKVDRRQPLPTAQISLFAGQHGRVYGESAARITGQLLSGRGLGTTATATPATCIGHSRRRQQRSAPPGGGGSGSHRSSSGSANRSIVLGPRANSKLWRAILNPPSSATVR